MTSPIPDNYPRLAPYLIIDGASAAMAFYVDVLGFSKRGEAIAGPDGTVGHAELQLGDSVVMLADEFPDMNTIGPKGVGGSPVMLHVYVEDVDAVFDAALNAGATQEQAPEDKFYGDRSASFTDPWGHRWSIATHIEDVSPEEMARRAAEAMGG